MKKIIYLLLLVIPILTFSQKNDEKKEIFRNKGSLFKGYVAAGLNINQIDGDNDAGYNIIGANVGGGVFINYTDKFSNSLEISYSMKGAKSGFRIPLYNPKYLYYQMDYIEVPLLFNYHDFKIAIFQIGMAFGTVIRTNFQGANGEFPFDDYYSSNLDMVFGATFLIKKHWGINFKFNYSILNNLKNGPTRGSFLTQSALISSRSGGFSNWYHNVLTFRAMYIF